MMKTFFMRAVAIALCVITVFGLVALFLRRKDEAGSGLTTQVANSNRSKIKPDTVMITMNESYSVTADTYFYHALGLRNEYAYQYGEEIFDYYPELVIDILDEVDSILIDNAAYMLWGSEVGFELSEEDLLAFEEQVEDLKDYLIESGTTFAKHLKENNLNDQLFRDVYLTNMYVNKFLTEYIFAEMPNLEVSDEALEVYMTENSVIAAKHILVTDESGLEYDDQLKLAEEILARIDDGEDFEALMVEFSNDPGLETNPNGYTFRMGEFIPVFETATREMNVGSVSDIVESDYGFHIIMRIEVDYDVVKEWVQEEMMEQTRLEYEMRLDPKTTKARDDLVLLDMKPVI